MLIELVERNISYLYTYLPVMPAPQRELSLPEATGSVMVQTKEAKTTEALLQIKGMLPVQADADSSVYVVCDGTVYEAFCLADGGFGAYIPGEAQAVACYVNGQLQVFSAE